MKVWHILRDCKGKALPVRLIFYDTETWEEQIDIRTFKHRLRLGCACWVERPHGRHRYRELWFTFRAVSEFWDWVMGRARQGSRTYLIAHNQHFDFIVVNGFGELARRGWEMKTPIIDSKLFMVTFRKGSRSIRVLDSVNWFNFSLNQLGKWVGLPKLRIDFAKASDSELERYCRRDVEILKETFLKWLEFIQRNDLGNFRETISAQAFQAYRHRFMDYPIYIHAHPQVTKLERESYRGGRCECFRLGKVEGVVHALDFNSLYPSVMRDNVFPCQLLRWVPRASLAGLKRCLDRFAVIAKVRVRMDEPAIAYKGERLIFPVGKFNVTLTSPELEYVLEHGKILEVNEYVVYDRAPIFKRYVTELYELRKRFRQQGDVVGDQLTKLLLNSLYGKFGQRQDVMRPIGEAPPDVVDFLECFNLESGEWFKLLTFGGKVFMRLKGDREGFHSFPAIASFVTAYGRMRLWDAMKTAGLENVMYVDTDSLFVNEEGFQRLGRMIGERELGKLKHDKIDTDLYIWGAKDYVFAGEVVRKGIRWDARKIKPNVYYQPRFLRFRSLQRLESLDTPIVEGVVKVLRREYKKGVVLPDGRVKPFVLP